MENDSLLQELKNKTLKTIGKDVSLFRCDDKQIHSVEYVMITQMQTPISSKKQTLSFEGKVCLRFKEDNNIAENVFPFQGSIEVMNYNAFMGLKDAPFVIHIHR